MLFMLTRDTATSLPKNTMLQNNREFFICRSHGLDDHMEKVLKVWRKKLGISNRNLIKALPRPHHRQVS